jgi:hypothetical protein
MDEFTNGVLSSKIFETFKVMREGETSYSMDSQLLIANVSQLEDQGSYKILDLVKGTLENTLGIKPQPG